jgi:hypothetical protein
MRSITLWGDNANNMKDMLLKGLRMKWNKNKKHFYRDKLDAKTLKKIMSFCLKNAVNYRTDDGQSYEVVPSEVIETSNRELRDWGPDTSKDTAHIEEEVDYEQMWEEYKEEDEG